MHARLLLVILAGAFASLLIAAPAHAQRARTFVASYGQDNPTCSFTQPCRNFQTAYANTAIGGEVTAIDSAGFGPLFIQHSVTITSPTGVEAGIVPSSGSNAIGIVAGPSDVVVLRGLTLEGGGGLNGLEGISLSEGGTLEILDCVIKDFHDGVFVEPETGTTQVTIKNTTVVNSGNAGIYITPHNSASAIVNLNQVTTDLNGYGMYIDQTPTTGSITATITNSHAVNNVTTGIVLNATNSLDAIAAWITGTTVMQNCPGCNNDLQVNGATFALLSGDKIAFLTGTTSAVSSDGTNFIYRSTGPGVSSMGTQ